MSETQLDMFATAAPKIALRAYQEEALAAVLREFATARSTLVVHATGLGKTVLAQALALHYRGIGQRTLFLAPTIEITHQSYSAMRRVGLSATLEQAANRATRPLPDVVTACVATMRGDRLASFRADDFGLVIFDEAHGSLSGSHAAIRERFVAAKLLGLTATPDRADRKSLGAVYETVAHEVSMLQGIEAGHLAPLFFRTARTDFDATRLRTIAGEISVGSVESELVRSGLLHQAAGTLAELAQGERTVAFLPTVASSKAFCSELQARGVAAGHIDGETPSIVRQELFARVRKGTLSVLSNVGCLVEGFDLPQISVVALLNPTRSRSRMAQMIGRGTRNAPGKERCLVIDFCPGRLTKGRLASPVDALAGEMLPDRALCGVQDGSLIDALRQAERTEKAAVERELAAAERARKKATRVAELAALATRQTIEYETREHDARDLLSAEWALDNAAAEERESRRRQRAGECTLKQAKLVGRYGLDTHMSFARANSVISILANNGWRMSESTRSKIARIAHV